MRALELALAAAISLCAATPAYADPPGSGSHRASGQVRHRNGAWVSPNWGPNGHYRGWGPYGGPAVPTFWVWGPSGGAFDYPFSDWRGPTGGWGNP
jgi:hypothetical protein